MSRLVAHRIAAAACVVAAGLALRTVIPLNPNLVWLGYLADQSLSGVEVYRAYVEINPPLAWWLLLPSVTVRQSLGGQLPGVVHVGVVILVLLLAAAALVLTPNPIRSRLAPWIAFVALVLPGIEFGQRDHLIGLLFLPAALVMARGAPERHATIAHGSVVGILIGAACCLKPHYLPAGAFVMVAARRSGHPGLNRWSAAALTAAGLTGVAYCAAVLVMEPAFLEVVREYGRLYAGWHSAGLTGVLVVSLLVALSCLLALVGTEGSGRVALLLGLLLSGAVIQAKGFAYHFLPVTVVATVLVPAALGASGHFLRRVPAAVVALLAAWALTFNGARLVRRRLEDSERAMHDVPAGSSVLILSHILASSWPAVIDHGWTWTSSFPSSWWMEAIIDRHGSRWCRQGSIVEADLSQAERRALDRGIADLLATRPDAILSYMPVRRPGGACYEEGRLSRQEEAVRSYQIDPLELLGTDLRVRSLLTEYTRSASADGRWRLLRRAVVGGRRPSR